MTEQQPQLAIESIQTLGSSFNAKTPWIRLNQKWQPNANFNIELEHEKHGEDQYQVSLILKVNVEQDKNEIFDVSVKQVGTFRIKGYDEQNMTRVLEIFCPTLLFPYARQVISDQVMRSNYPAFHCPHIDFESRYQNKYAKQDEKQK